MTSKLRRLFGRVRLLGIGGALILAFGLTTAIGARAQTFRSLLSFDKADGGRPLPALIQGRDGTYYGTSQQGGANDLGVVFEIAPGAARTTLYSFCSQANCADGAHPNGRLVLGVDGNLYGATGFEGSYGTVFKITPRGTLTTLYTFCPGDNCVGVPNGLAQASNGDFYGTTQGTAFSYGTVFKITPSGTLTTLYTFTGQADGGWPNAALVQAADGNLYGINSVGGDFGMGAFFKMTPAGKLTPLYSFPFESINDGLLLGADGNLYDTTGGGPSCEGALFRITLQGELTIVYCFTGGADGQAPSFGPVQATDGNFYGTTSFGGANDRGTIWEATPAGVLTSLHSFDYTDGYLAQGLLQATNGTFYGLTACGGIHDDCDYGCGTAFSLSTGLAPFVTFVRDSGKVGWTAEILGQGFIGASGVSFNGAPANFTVRRDTFITATVPTGATTGYVTVTTPNGVLKSNVPFYVIR